MIVITIILTRLTTNSSMVLGPRVETMGYETSRHFRGRPLQCQRKAHSWLGKVTGLARKSYRILTGADSQYERSAIRVPEFRRGLNNENPPQYCGGFRCFSSVLICRGVRGRPILAICHSRKGAHGGTPLDAPTGHYFCFRTSARTSRRSDPENYVAKRSECR